MYEKMKTVLLIAILLVVVIASQTGCSQIKSESPNYIGKIPYYVVHQPHADLCACGTCQFNMK